MADTMADEVAHLRAEVEQLQAENRKLGRRLALRLRARRAGLVLLLVLGCLLAAMAAIGLWTRATVLNTDRYVETMAPIARSASVQEAVADRLDVAITSRVDFDALAREVLPDRADVLAPAISTGVRSLIRRELDQFVHGPRFPELWDRVNRRAHATVVGLLTTGRSGRLELEGNTVYLDLSALVDQVKARLQARGLDRIAGAIPASVDGRIPLLSSGSFERARSGVHRFERLTVLLPILALLCLLAHVLLSHSRRRAVLRVALGLAVTALLLLAVVGIGRTLYLDAIDNATLPRDAASDIFDALIGALRGGLRLAVVAALLAAALSLLAGAPARRAIAAAGPRGRAAAARIAADPRTTWVAAHRAALQWGVVVLGALVLVAWSDPTAAVVLVDAALVVLAIWLIALLARSAGRPPVAAVVPAGSPEERAPGLG